ncbi:UPF0280 family protein [Methanonatronarchaeum sp. AMET-Sl]|uniref:UPF0280 family protein n=1 Tax=Methanonatronarchaeum sp. AMET-Sl TaxID=3037654 RepID=UPI00244DC7A8|nr:UPF0280 family protein [Methanonatronarchaeum sp. AMET-Sl]WGI18073.1 UPF0280 family protein [Methanonatronarchaeum sp. AMET-Sl]
MNSNYKIQQTNKKWSKGPTKLSIKTKNPKTTQKIIKKAKTTQKQIKNHIKQNPEFKTSMKPLKLDEENYTGPIKMMIEASNKTGVGPLAAVAGTISHNSGKNINEPILIDNGGDIYLQGTKKYNIAIYAGQSPLSNKISIKTEPKNGLGICTSAGTVGHSLSLGKADAVTTISRNTATADAAATAIANHVNHPDTEKAIKNGLNKADDLKPNIQGAIIIKKDKIGTTGKIPEINLLKNKQKK